MDCGSGPAVGGTSTRSALAGSGQCGLKRTVSGEREMKLSAGETRDDVLPMSRGVRERTLAIRSHGTEQVRELLLFPTKQINYFQKEQCK